MGAVEHGQNVGRQTLHTERDSSKTALAQLIEDVLIHRIWICFNRYLGIVSQPKGVVDSAK